MESRFDYFCNVIIFFSCFCKDGFPLNGRWLVFVVISLHSEVVSDYRLCDSSPPDLHRLSCTPRLWIWLLSCITWHVICGTNETVSLCSCSTLMITTRMVCDSLWGSFKLISSWFFQMYHVTWFVFLCICSTLMMTICCNHVALKLKTVLSK